MKLLLPVIASVASFVAAPRIEAKDTSKDEAAIKALIRESERGYTERNPDKVVVMYDNPQLMFFDLMPPMKDCCGVKRGKEKVTEFLAGTVGPVTGEFRDLEVHVDHDMAYTTAFFYFAFTSKDGKKHELTTRITDVWRRLNGRWSTVHEHCSLPAKVTDWME